MLALGALAVALIWTFRAALVEPLGLFQLDSFEYWFFLPNRDSAALSLLIAAWMFATRARRLRALGPAGDPSEDRTPAAKVGLGLALGGALVFAAAWSIAAQAPTLHVFCLGGFILWLATSWGGRSAAALVAMPTLVLLAAASVPSPLLSEILWGLQRATAAGTHLILNALGFAADLQGTELRLNENAYLVIEACSGWRSLQIFLLLALVSADLRNLCPQRTALLVAAVFPITLALNVLRVTLIVLTQEGLAADAFQNHTPQGLLVLSTGSVLLYVAATLLDNAPVDPTAATDAPTSATPAPVSRTRRAATMRWAGVALLMLVAVGLLARFIEGRRGRPISIEFSQLDSIPSALGDWRGETIAPDFFFPYESSVHPQFHSAIRNPEWDDSGALVDLFVAYERDLASVPNRQPNSKLARPASDWNVLSLERTRIWSLGVDGYRAFVSRESGRQTAFITFWRVRDGGLWREVAEAFFGLDRCLGPPQGCARAVVRIAVGLAGDTPRNRDLAMKTTTRFIRDFGKTLTDPGI